MQKQKDAQCSFFELTAAAQGYHNHLLETIDKMVDLRGVEKLLESTYRSGGRPAHRAEVMLKIMLLQHLYGLSDPQAEEWIKDRISFHRFVGLKAEEAVPDETSICRFRQRILQAGLQDKLLEEVNRQLEEAGFILKTTTLVDATLIRSARRTPTKEEMQSGKTPDGDATFTGQKHSSQAHYGYKAHVASDGTHNLIRTAKMTTASVADISMFRELVCGDEKRVYADKGYSSKAHRQWLRKQGIGDGIIRRAARAHPLTPQQQKTNRRKARFRAKIENIFGYWKQWCGYRRARYLGLLKNQLELTLKAIAYNLKRVFNILQCQPA